MQSVKMPPVDHDSTPMAAPTAGEVLLSLLRRPVENLWRCWNWKSAVLSACLRGGIFFAANIGAGVSAALGAMSIESAFYVAVAGFYGAILQSFRYARPAWLATLTTMALIPAINHAMEFALHWASGTKKLKAAIIASVCLSMLSTLFNLFAMRRGAFIVGTERRSLPADMRQLPRLMFDFLAVIPRALWQSRLKPDAN